MPKLCKNCSRELQKRVHESEARFQGKKFCTSKCARVYLKTNNQGWWATKGSQLATADEIAGRQKYLTMRGGEL